MPVFVFLILKDWIACGTSFFYRVAAMGTYPHGEQFFSILQNSVIRYLAQIDLRIELRGLRLCAIDDFKN